MKRQIFSLTVVIVMLLGNTVTAMALLNPSTVIERAIWCLGKEEQEVEQRVINEQGDIYQQNMGRRGMEMISPVFSNNNKNKVEVVLYALAIDNRETAITTIDLWKMWLTADGWKMVKKETRRNQMEVIIYSKGAYWILIPDMEMLEAELWVVPCIITNDKTIAGM
jgi:hypothetical protein